MANRAIMRASEHDIQCAFMDIVRLHYTRYPDLEYLRAFPNGSARPSKINLTTGKRYSVEGQKLRDEGVAPGPLDIILPARRRDYVGMWYEFKVPGRTFTPAQNQYAAYLGSQGWCVGIWFDAERAWANVKRYLEMPK
jgi:hypothetical protein